jgi:hypothetical protein
LSKQEPYGPRIVIMDAGFAGTTFVCSLLIHD